MHKIISFKKEITFNNSIEEIVSISVDDKLELDNLKIKGNFVIEGEYLTVSRNESFHFDIPYLGYLEDEYDTNGSTIKVDDFYYEIVEPNKLALSIDILVDDLKVKKLINEEVVEEDIREAEIVETTKEDILEDKSEEREKVIFKEDYAEAYMTYRIYIVREGDTIESILDKYGLSLDELSKYNVINELNIGDKLIIPNEKNK